MLSIMLNPASSSENVHALPCQLSGHAVGAALSLRGDVQIINKTPIDEFNLPACGDRLKGVKRSDARMGSAAQEHGTNLKIRLLRRLR